jgi:hypothetical protein
MYETITHDYPRTRRCVVGDTESDQNNSMVQSKSVNASVATMASMLYSRIQCCRPSYYSKITR